MKHNEVVELLKDIQTYYPTFLKDADVPRVIKAWKEVLRNESYERIKANLVVYAKTNTFEPKLSSLLKVDEARGFQAPGVDETNLMLQQQRKEREEAENEKTVQAKKKALEEIKRMLEGRK